MRMEFYVKDKSLLDGLRSGDQIDSLSRTVLAEKRSPPSAACEALSVCGNIELRLDSGLFSTLCVKLGVLRGSAVSVV